MVANSRVPDYRLLQRRLGITRNIVVTPTPFPATVADNLVTLDALAAFGANARGVAIVYPGITDAELKTLADGGVRGIRFSLTAADGSSPPIPATTVDAIESLSKRVNALGWHVQFNVDAEQIVAAEALLNRLPSPIVFDHMGHMPQPAGIEHPAYKIVRGLIDKGRTWVKLSVTYDFEQGRPAHLCGRQQGRRGLRQGRARADGVGQQLAAPERDHQARRCQAVRPSRRMGAERGDPPAHPGRESGDSLRLREIRLSDGGAA